MRQLLPHPADDVDLATVYGVARPGPGGRPWVLLDMVTAVDGATAVDAHSQALGGPGDQRVFHTLRSLADVVLVAAGTARAEDYGPPTVDDDVRRARIARGQAPRPGLALVTRSVDLSPHAKMFGDRDNRPVVIAPTSSPAERRAALGHVAEVVVAGGDEVDLAAALAMLHERGARLVVAEGGPSLNGALLDAGLVDEICMTLSAVVAGGDSARLITGASEAVRRFDLVHVLEEDGSLFLRYVRRR